MIFTNNLSPILFELGPLEVRWYGALFAVGMMCFYLVTRWIFKREKLSLDLLDSLATYLFFGLLIGARLGHVFFYRADYFLDHPWEIFAVWNGGLASHGGAIGIATGFFLWAWLKKVDFRRIIGLIVVAMPLNAAFVRIGNFFNSEIYGHPTGGDYGVIFARLNEDFPRHPVQFYEAGWNLVIFAILLTLYLRAYDRLPKAFLAFLYIGLYFLGRFVIEFWKDLQGPLENWPITMGQLLSIAPVLLAVGYFSHLAWKRFKPSSS